MSSKEVKSKAGEGEEGRADQRDDQNTGRVEDQDANEGWRQAKRGVLSTKFKTLVGAAARMSKAMKSVDEERGLYEILHARRGATKRAPRAACLRRSFIGVFMSERASVDSI